jgi:hypothetical protein
MLPDWLIPGGQSASPPANKPQNWPASQNKTRSRLGITMDEWQQRVSRHPLIPQFFDREHAMGQQAHEWSQQVWEANARMVGRNTKALLIREFAVPGWDQLTQETPGLAEVTYPAYPDHRRR